MNAYLEKETKGYLNKEIALQGLQKIGACVTLISKVDLLNWNEKDAEDAIFYGNVGFIKSVAERYNYPFNPVGHVPDELQHLSGREIKEVTLDEALAESKNRRVFIKPIPSKNKLFTGFVLNNSPMDMFYLANYFLNKEEQVLMSPEIKLVSEWRCFIHDKTVLDAKHYKGNFRVSPDYAVADTAAHDWKDSPIAYSCDLGVTKEGETVIIECNDVMSLGFYGLDFLYAGSMLRDRWEEIHRNKKI